MNEGCKLKRGLSLAVVIVFISAALGCSAQTDVWSILAQPQNVAVSLGSNATFSVVADASPPVSYQWAFMGTNLDGATLENLLVTNAQPFESGLYTVTVSNSQEVIISGSALLSVVGLQGWGLSGPILAEIPTGLTNLVTLSALHDHCLALTSGGRVLAWGDDSYGLTSVPSDLTNAIAICAGNEHYLALRSDGTITVWGNQSQSGVPTDLGKVVGIAAGDSGVSFALKADGTLTGWGLYGDTNVPSGLTNVVRVASGGNQHLAIKADGTVVSWGPNDYGELDPPDNLSNVVAIAAAEEQSMALRADGTIVVWGVNTNGQNLVPSDATNVVAIALSDSHCIALKSDGTVLAWGEQNGMTPAPSGLPKATAIAAGDFSSLILLRDSAPHLTVEPWNRVVPSGFPASFTGKAVGESLSYQWQLDGTNIPGATQDTYSITAAQPSDAGNYRLTISNQLGTAMSQFAQLTVVYAITVQPPGLPAQPDQTIDELSELVVTNTASDVNVPNLALSYLLASAPSGATIDCMGVIRWTPSLTQAPSTNTFTTIVTDNALPPASATNSFIVRVLPTNQPPILQLPDSWTLVATIPFSQQILATDPDNLTDSLTFSLGLDAPAGASVTTSGVFSWIPNPDQAPSTNVVTIWVSDPLNGVSKTIAVIVHPLNTTQPVLPIQSDQLIFGQTQMVVTNTATDSDNPPDTLSYQLLFPPAGATIDSNGVIRWTPDSTQEPSTNFFITEVTDNGMPPMSRRNIFKVVALVSNQPPLLEMPDSWTLAEGAHFSQQIVASDPDQPVSALTFTLSSGAPVGVTLSADGVFSWTPTEAQAPSTNPVTVCVSDGTTTVCKTVQIIVSEDPIEILSQPESISVGFGSNARFSVLADGLTPLSYQWQLNGTNLPGETQSTLLFTNAQSYQSGFYSVIVSNASGTLTSDPALLSVAGIVTWGPPDARSLVPAELTNVLAIAAGAFFDLALKSDGTVVAWGDNYFGQLNVPPGLTNVIAIAAGAEHSLALRVDGTVVCWGTQWPVDQPVPADLTNAVAIDVGFANNLALRSDGTVTAWGRYSYSYSLPSIAPTGLSNVVAISAGGTCDLALKADGTVVSWNDSTAELLATPADLTNVIAISALPDITCGGLALKADGVVEGWSGQFTNQLRLLDLPPGLTNVVAISLKGEHGMAILNNGNLVASWGTNVTEIVVPLDLPNVVAVSGGRGGHSLALLRDGSPTMTVQPWDRLVPRGNDACLEAKAVGMQSMVYQWQFNGANVAGATNDTYTITNTQPANAGTYNLAVSNQVGMAVSRRAKLVVSTEAPADTNQPPVLPVPNDWTVCELSQLVVVNTAIAPNAPAGGLTYELINPPDGATVDANGIIRWTPSDAQAPGTNTITTIVTDNGTPSLRATNSFVVVVNQINSPPILPAQLARTISALSELVVTNTASNPVPTAGLIYELINPPAGASIDASGVIRWIPNRAQGPGTNTITSFVTVNGIARLRGINQFVVTVSAPVLSAPANYVVNVGQAVAFTNSATDNDPARKFAFSLNVAPKGARMTPDTGIFTWRPQVSAADTTNRILLRVMDDSFPPISDDQAFTVVVNPLQPVFLTPFGLTNGGIELRISGSIGPDYIIQTTTTLTTWMSLETNSPSLMPFYFIDANGASDAMRIYRVQLGP